MEPQPSPPPDFAPVLLVAGYWLVALGHPLLVAVGVWRVFFAAHPLIRPGLF